MASLAISVAAAGLVGVEPAAASLESTGQWSGVVEWPLLPVHAALTPQGTVMTYGSLLGVDGGFEGGHVSYDIWDPTLGTGSNAHAIQTNSTQVDLFCSVQIVDPVRDVIVTAGGDNKDPETTFADDGVTIYSQTAGLQVQPSLNEARWYPTGTVLPNGDILIEGGSAEGLAGTGVLTPELFNVDTGWTMLTGINSSYAYGDDQFRWWYPRSWVAPDGNVFGISGSNMYRVDPAGNGSLTEMGNLGNRTNIMGSSTAVMYRPGQILQVGGGAKSNEDYDQEGSPNATRIDINSGTPVMTDMAPMELGRHWATSTVLPDGQVLVTGGSSQQNQLGGVGYAPELWNPDTNTWTTLSSQTRSRLYHSMALLLPDATVLVGGGGNNGPEQNLNAEIFSPPYLFDGNSLAARPSITAPSQLQYGEHFSIDVSPDVVKVSLVRAGAVTHSFNGGQRWMELPITGSGGTRSVSSPANANLAPPGLYMLFGLNTAGTPSMAAMVNFDPPPQPDEPPPAPEPLPDPPFSGNITLAETIEEIQRSTDYDPVNHGYILRLYRAVYNREADVGGAKYWIHTIFEGHGLSLEEVIFHMAADEIPEFAATYADVRTNEDFVERIYWNMQGRAPDPGGFAYWVDLMDNGLSRSSTVRWVSESPEFKGKYPYPKL